MYLIGAGLIVLLAITIVALGYRGKAKAQQHHAEMQQRRADNAETINTSRQQLDHSLADLEQTQRQETIDETQPQRLAARDALDNDWGPSGLPSSESADDSTGRAAASDSARTAID